MIEPDFEDAADRIKQAKEAVEADLKKSLAAGDVSTAVTSIVAVSI